MTTHKTAPLTASSENYRALIAERRGVLSEQLRGRVNERDRFAWELGCGHGHFLTAYAQAHPHQLCVGVDIASDRIARAQRKRDRAKLSNLHFFQTDARVFIDALPMGATFSAVFVLFPDPWPKLRHHKHRIMQPRFLHTVAERAASDCRLYFRTDHGDYFQSTLEVVRAHPRWELASDPWPFEFETVFQRRAPRYDSLVARLRP